MNRGSAGGDHRVSVVRKAGETVSLSLVAGGSGVLRVRDNSGGRAVTRSVPGVKKVGLDFEIPVTKGLVVTADFGGK